jgi:hypothetical protein
MLEMCGTHTMNPDALEQHRELDEVHSRAIARLRMTLHDF